MKTAEKQQAIVLRQQGNSMKNIARILKVSTGTVSRWTRNIDFDLEHKVAVSSTGYRFLETYKDNGKVMSNKAREKRTLFQKIGSDRMTSVCPDLFTLGCMLYWCERSKSKNAIVMSNSDPDVQVLFVKFLKECLGIPKDRITLRIHGYLNNGISQEEIEAYWLSLLGLSKENLRKGFYDAHSPSSSRRKRNLLYGTSHITVCDTEKLHMIYGGIAAVCGKDNKYLF